jgi:hypothetical protein
VDLDTGVLKELDAFSIDRWVRILNPDPNFFDSRKYNPFSAAYSASQMN